ncbi:MAG: class I SAM-dependent methyltransferase [Candidatus Marsarchaeota archaeon]|nr:class I SAM-dependent methyltransferase [Candidatus Marsarchaeota archaeon]
MIKNLDLYEKKDERFGFIMSRAYNFFTMTNASKNIYNTIISDITAKKFNSLLDIGCGTGVVIKNIAKKHNGTYYGIDPSPSMINIANKNNINVTFILGSNRKLPKNKKFDIIFSSLSFHHWPDKETSITHIIDSLNPGGTFVIYESDKDKIGYLTRIFIGSHAMTKKEFKEISFNIRKKIKIRHKNSLIIAEIKKVP